MVTVKLMTTVRTIILLAAVVLVAGCGGDSGGGGASAESVPTYTISGRITNDYINQSIPVIVSGLNSETTRTNSADGRYSFSGLVRGTYTITPSMVWHKFTPPCQAVTIDRGDVKDIDFTFSAREGNEHDISGFITVDGTAVQGIIVTLTGTVSTTAASDGTGYYCFPDLAPGRYTLKPTGDDYTFTPASQTVVLSDTDAIEVNFSAP